MDIKYTSRKRGDGLGGQLEGLASLLIFADRFDLSVLCDLRTFPFFKGVHNETGFPSSEYYSDEEASRLLEFHPRVIYNSKELDSIRQHQNKPWLRVLEWGDWWPLQREIINWLSGGRAGPVKYGYPNEGLINVWKYLLERRESAVEGAVPNYSELPIKVRDRAQFELLLPRVKNSTVVHARLGNGELEVPANEFNVSASRARMTIAENLFLEEMRKHDSDFFVCSDDVRFVNKCQELFGDRVFHSDRCWLPYGCGPGHNATTHSYPVLTPINTNPWTLICDALLDMELMCEGKRIICNKSQFNYFARQRINSESTTILL